MFWHRLGSLRMGELSLVHALGLEPPSQRLLKRLSDRAVHPSPPTMQPIVVPRWQPGPPVPPVDQTQAAEPADGEEVDTEKSAPEASAETGAGAGTEMKS